MRTRLLVAVPGVLAGCYGVWLLLELGFDNLWATVVWAAGGVIVHDGVLAPAVLVACLLVARLPAPLRSPAAVGLVILSTATVVAIPVLGRFGARPDNPTLLDRPYWSGWLVIAGLTLVGVLATTVLGARRTTRSGSGQSSRG